MAELCSDAAVDKGNFSDRRRLALDSLMTELQQRLSGDVEAFVTHLQRQKVISKSDWQIIERSYKTDETRIFHLLNDVLVWRVDSWNEILVFLYNCNCADLAQKLQSAAKEPTVNLTTNISNLTVAENVNTSLSTMEPVALVQPSINVDWCQFIRDVVDFHLGDYRVVESFNVDGDSVPIESVWVDLQLDGSEKSFSDYEEIFAQMREKKCRLAIVRGQPGSGKTTLAKKIAYDWAKEEKKEIFDLVLAVPLRDVQSKSDLLEMAVGIHIGNDDDIKRICADLRRERLKILIVLDGLDEFQIPPDSPLSKIFGSGLSGVNVVSASPIRFDFDLIVTSRPFACQLIHANIMTVKYEIVGFSEDRKIEFVEKRCKTQKGKTKAMAYFIQSNCVKEISQNPLLLTMICFLSDRGELVPSTLTQLFATFVHRMLVRAAQKNAVGNDFDPSNWHQSELLKHIGSLALFGVIKCQYQFNQAEMQMCHVSKEYFRSGLIHYRSDPVGLALKCDFPHRSIQDFLAAFYSLYYWSNKTLLETTGWPTDIWPQTFVNLISPMKVELLMVRLLTTDSQFCRFLFGLTSGRTDVSPLSLLQTVLNEIVEFYTISPLDLIFFLGDDMADCSGMDHLVAGQFCNDVVDRINDQHFRHPSQLQIQKMSFAKWKGVERRVRNETASVVIGKLTQQFTGGFKLTRLDDNVKSFNVGTDNPRSLKVMCLQVAGNVDVYVNVKVADKVLADLRSASNLEPSKIEILSVSQTGLDHYVIIRVSNDMTNLDLWNFMTGSSWAHDVFAKRITTLKEKSKLQSYEKLLPDVICLIKHFPTTAAQGECLMLIRSLLPPNITELAPELKANLIEIMLTVLQSNVGVGLIMDCAKILAQLAICDDPICRYTKTVEILLKTISNPEIKTNFWTIWLLNGILSESDENRRNLVGQMGGVEQICGIIKQQLKKTCYDQISELCWTSLWHLCISIDNSEIFSVGGVELFHLCYEKFCDNVKMVEEITGMMMRISRFGSLRPQLVSRKNFELFWKILLKFGDNTAVSYRCVDTFDRFLCDSTLIWPLECPTLEEATHLLIEMINKWQLDALINLSWDSFDSILSLLLLEKSPLTELISVWTISNLTTIDAPKYCRMLSEADGVEILTVEVILNPKSSSCSIRMAIVAVENTNQWESERTSVIDQAGAGPSQLNSPSILPITPTDLDM